MPVLTVPQLSPQLVKGKLEGLKSFAMSVVTAILGYWDDSGGTWDSDVLTWDSGAISYPSSRASVKPFIGLAKVTSPGIEGYDLQKPTLKKPELGIPQVK